jgi:hypothetical protein
MSDGGKGSKPRPFNVSNEEYANRWDAIFGMTKDGTVLEDDCACGGVGPCQCPDESAEIVLPE